MSKESAVLHTILLTFLLARFAAAQDLPVAAFLSPSITHHELHVELIPRTHELIAQDALDVDIPQTATEVVFSLAATLQVESVKALTRSADAPSSMPLAVSFVAEQVPPSSQRILVTLPPGHALRMTLLWKYRGPINDSPREPRHLRFVTPSETAGHIGPEGVYLSSESQWYPDIEGSRSSFQLSGSVPRDWTIVTQGKNMREVIQGNVRLCTWVVQDQSEALTMVANKFVAKIREWKGLNGRPVQLAAYLFPDNAALADEYLDATEKYLQAYIPLLGDYPFEKFAVVENFFASGLGMPSFTLLGSGSIKRHYTQPYALGHEIVHSWIGNSVFNRTGYGNWVEGLTTYLANYYWHELTHDPQQALDQRRLMIQAYSLYVRPQQDYALVQFLRKSDERDNAIGYQKSAFVFHLLRREIGEEAFWSALKTFVREFQNHPADWTVLEGVFSRVSGQNLRWFFKQWVEEAGAPELVLSEATGKRVSQDSDAGPWHLTIRVRQNGKPFRVTIPLEIATKDVTEKRWFPINARDESIELEVAAQPLDVRLDPELMVFRRMQRDQLPPMLNVFVTDPTRAVLETSLSQGSPLRQVVTRMVDQDSALPQDLRAVVVSEPSRIPPTGSVLLLAEAGQHRAVQSLIQESCGNRVKLGDAGFEIDGQRYEGPAGAVLVSCHRANVPGSVITLLYGVTADALATVSRLVFFYGWQSYVVFNQGVVAKRDLWRIVSDTKEVGVDAHR